MSNESLETKDNQNQQETLAFDFYKEKWQQLNMVQDSHNKLYDCYKRLLATLLIVIALWFATICGFVWYLNQYEFTSYDVNSQDGGNANFIGNDGDINNYGESESKDEDKEININESQRNGN